MCFVNVVPKEKGSLICFVYFLVPTTHEGVMPKTDFGVMPTTHGEVMPKTHEGVMPTTNEVDDDDDDDK